MGTSGTEEGTSSTEKKNRWKEQLLSLHLDLNANSEQEKISRKKSRKKEHRTVNTHDLKLTVNAEFDSTKVGLRR